MTQPATLRSRSFGLWTTTAITIRLPNAGAPLAVVFAGHGAAGSYTAGGLLATVFVVGEIAGSSLMGWLGRSERAIRDLGIGLIIGAVGYAFLALQVLGVPGAPWLTVSAALLAGGGTAQSPGILKMLLGRVVAEEGIAQAFSADSLVTELVWLAAPPLVAWSAVTVSPALPLLVSATLLVVAIPLSVRTARHAGTLTTERATARPSRRALLGAWPAYLTSAAALSLVAVAELILPSLLQYRGYSAAWSGVILAIYGGASALSAIAYGGRRWAGSPRSQSIVMLAITAAAIATAAAIPNVFGIAAALVAAGAAQALVMITRNLTLRAQLPPELHSAGFTTMYAVQGGGYALSAALASSILAIASAPIAIVASVGLMMLFSMASVIAEIAGARVGNIRR